MIRFSTTISKSPASGFFQCPKKFIVDPWAQICGKRRAAPEKAYDFWAKLAGGYLPPPRLSLVRVFDATKYAVALVLFSATFWSQTLCVALIEFSIRFRSRRWTASLLPTVLCRYVCSACIWTRTLSFLDDKKTLIFAGDLRSIFVRSKGRHICWSGNVRVAYGYNKERISYPNRACKWIESCL